MFDYPKVWKIYSQCTNKRLDTTCICDIIADIAKCFHKTTFLLCKLMCKIWRQGCSFLLCYLKLVLFTKTYFRHFLFIILYRNHFGSKWAMISKPELVIYFCIWAGSHLWNTFYQLMVLRVHARKIHSCDCSCESNFSLL